MVAQPLILAFLVNNHASTPAFCTWVAAEAASRLANRQYARERHGRWRPTTSHSEGTCGRQSEVKIPMANPRISPVMEKRPRDIGRVGCGKGGLCDVM